MKSNFFLGFMTFAALAGCNKTLELTPKGQEVVTQTKINQQKKMAREGALREAADFKRRGVSRVDVNRTDGTLDLLSDLDVSEVSGGLLFSDPTPYAFRDISRPSFAIQNSVNGSSSNASLGFVKQSNLVFRSIVKMPPRLTPNAVKSIDGITLTLTGVRVSAVSGTSSVTLANQILCMFQHKECSGIFPTDSSSSFNTAAGYTALNANFSSLAKESDFILTHTIREDIQDSANLDSTLFSYVSADGTGTLTLDLMQIFGISTQAEALQWLDRYSVNYDQKGYFRKFRFILGNSIYADSGKLTVQMTVDPSQVPADYASARAVPAISNDALRVIANTDWQGTKDVKDLVYKIDFGSLGVVPNMSAADGTAGGGTPDGNSTANDSIDPVSDDSSASIQKNLELTRGLASSGPAPTAPPKKQRNKSVPRAANGAVPLAPLIGSQAQAPVATPKRLSMILDVASAAKVKAVTAVLDANAAYISNLYIVGRYDRQLAADPVQNLVVQKNAKALADAISAEITADTIQGLLPKSVIATPKKSHCATDACDLDKGSEIALVLSDSLTDDDKKKISLDIKTKLDAIFQPAASVSN